MATNPFLPDGDTPNTNEREEENVTKSLLGNSGSEPANDGHTQVPQGTSDYSATTTNGTTVPPELQPQGKPNIAGATFNLVRPTSFSGDFSFVLPHLDLI